MADDWEDWEDEASLPTLPGTAGAAKLAALREPDPSKFADEDEGADDGEPADWEKDAAAGRARAVAAAARAPEKNKYAAKDAAADAAARADAAAAAAADPATEKSRRQAAVEAADLAAAFELFGTGGGGGAGGAPVVPTSAKEAESYGSALAARYVAVPLASSSHLKTVVKAFLRTALADVDAATAKEVESTAAGVRADKVKAEAAAKAAAAKAGKKKSLNVGRSGGSAGLDDFRDDLVGGGADDDYDFM